MLNALASISVIDGFFLVLVAATVGYGAIRVYLFIAEIGIVGAAESMNNDQEAQDVFIDLVKHTDESLLIHDDGNDDSQSVYNTPAVLDALATRIGSHKITVECFFNFRAPELRIVELAHRYPDNVKLYYRVPEGRPSGKDTHYKIVDDGKLVHLSEHGYEKNDREYKLWDATRAWKAGRRRYSRPWREQFDRDVSNADYAAA